ncbi:protein FAM32A [Cucurbita pepo subsp. pepo]|uniref:protein FAM32A n=1 Tax=Cucurbita pepo subsp. pepo TaxID=3664 RepID=UPI000C9D99BA|nr:protein FAM32A [Cucurbita pepo subsp. pepo]XP_023527035.1 protein FAM32A [Cucurbita pepo subsp. pepo]
MSSYDNVVGGKLKLKGKALDVKVGGVKKKKKLKKHQDQASRELENEHPAGGSAASGEMPDDANEEEEIDEANKSTEDGKVPHYDDHLTPAEKRYIEQKERIDVHRLAKKANKSHRDRIQDFNQYLANMSEHYDIPKVGPG